MSKRENELIKLQIAFDSLNQSTDKLMGAYEALKSEAVRLDLDLEQSRAFLSDILNSLNCGVVVTDLEGAIKLANPEAVRLGVDNSALVATWKNEMVGHNSGARIARPKLGYLNPDGKHFLITVSSLNKTGGGLSGFIFVMEEVTELNRLRKQSQRADRLSAVGEIAAGMAHEIRNPLGGMEIFASLLRRELENDDDKLKLLGHVTVGIEAINNVIHNFLLFTKEPKPDRNEFDLRDLILNILDFAKYVFEQNKIEVRASIPDESLPINADESLIRQAILNMIHNSVGAMPDGGIIGIEVNRVKGANGPERIEIVCSDTGCGVSEEIREKIFDPFFTTRDSGSGLGLSIISQIAQAHGGYVDLIDKKGDGAVFIVSLPQ
ncbi:MAG TPA: hypothetical protein ENI77_10585 [Nitrospirae bacterium]|nr:hypothetical protein [Nitrospirota bacterium]